MSDTLEKLYQRVLDLEAQVDEMDSDLEALENTVRKGNPVEPLKELIELRERNKAFNLNPREFPRLAKQAVG